MTPRPAPLELPGSDLQVLLADGSTLEAKPIVQIAADLPGGFGFGDFGEELDGHPRTFTYTCVVGGDIWKGDTADLEQRVTPFTEKRFETSGDLAVAACVVYVYPDWLRDSIRANWWYMLDATSSVGAQIGYAIDRLRKRRGLGGLGLWNRLIVVDRIAVHPTFRHQWVGARLLAHAILDRFSGMGDVAALAAYPMHNPFDDATPLRSEGAVRNLVRYYQRLGFRRALPRERITAKEPVVMYVSLNEHVAPPEPLRFRGLDPIGVR
ncbi:MAG: hypothetical protein ABFS34_05700 [Gemmatimonadota bacterium]